MNNKDKGELGEKDVIEKVTCPNCSKPLMLLPKNYPLFDIQCSACSFRAQVKSINSKPKSEILGAGWEIISKVLKSGYMIPPLIVNFKWNDKGIQKQEIRFYPFIPKNTLHNYTLSEKARRANYKMFRYTKLDELPFFVLYKD